MSWNHRIIRHKATTPDGKQHEYLSIHEVYYDAEGNITLWSENPTAPFGDDFNGLAQDVMFLRQAFRRPILDAEDMPQ